MKLKKLLLNIQKLIQFRICWFNRIQLTDWKSFQRWISNGMRHFYRLDVKNRSQLEIRFLNMPISLLLIWIERLSSNKSMKSRAYYWIFKSIYWEIMCLSVQTAKRYSKKTKGNSSSIFKAANTTAISILISSVSSEGNDLFLFI